MFPPPDSTRAKAIVLVHGAWVGEWSWLPVMPLLARSGRAVHAVSLTGHGARRHQGGPHVTLQDHVDDVCGLIETHDLYDVTLVGHSYGGRVITQTCRRVADRLSSLVYLDAHAPVAPDSGQSPKRTAAAEANGGMLPFAGYDPDPAHVGGERGVAWFLDRTAAQSFACLSSPWQTDIPDRLAKTYIYASANQPSRFVAYANAIRDDDAWTYHELDGPHFLMVSHPEQVTEIILSA